MPDKVEKPELYDVFSFDTDTNEWGRAGRSLAKYATDELVQRIQLNDVEVQVVTAGELPKVKRGEKIAPALTETDDTKPDA